MEMRKLRKMGGNGSGGVTLPKEMLREAGVVGPDGLDDNCYVAIDQDGDDDSRLELRLVGVGE